MRTAEQYIESLGDGRNVWLSGQRAESVAAHPGIGPTARTVAGILEAHHQPEHQDLLTEVEPDGTRVSRAFALPRSAEDLERLGEISTFVARRTLGLMSRMFDYGASVVRGFFDRRHEIAAGRAEPAAAIEGLYRRGRADALLVTFAFTDPPSGRGVPVAERDVLRMVRRTPEGIVVSGAKTVCTGAPYADEIVVLTFPAASSALSDRLPEQLLGFVVRPSQARMISLCRPPLAEHEPGSSSSPITRGLDEIDACLVFDEALIPHDRVLYAGDLTGAQICFETVSTVDVQSFTRRLGTKLEALLGLAFLTQQTLGLSRIPAVAKVIADLARHQALVSTLLRAAERSPTLAPWSSTTVLAEPVAVNLALQYAIEHYPEAVRAVELLAGQALVLLPTEEDLASTEIGPLYERYFNSPDMGAADRARLLRLIAQIVGSHYGSRQGLLEHYGLGGLAAVNARLDRLIPLQPAVATIGSFIELVAEESS